MVNLTQPFRRQKWHIRKKIFHFTVNIFFLKYIQRIPLCKSLMKISQNIFLVLIEHDGNGEGTFDSYVNVKLLY